MNALYLLLFSSLGAGTLALLLSYFFSKNSTVKSFLIPSLLLIPTITATVWFVFMTYISVYSANITLEAINLSQLKIISLFAPYVIGMIILCLIIVFYLKQLPGRFLLLAIALFTIQMVMQQSIGWYLSTFSKEKQDDVDFYLYAYYYGKSFVIPFLGSTSSVFMLLLYMLTKGFPKSEQHS